MNIFLRFDFNFSIVIYFKNFRAIQYLLVINVFLGSLGCYVLARRWVASFAGSLFAGAIYGFGPFMLGLAKFHPTAGFLAAIIPWLFCPAAFGHKAILSPCRRQAGGRWISWPLSALPFLVIPLFFQVSAHFRLFPVPIQAKLHLADLVGLLAPSVAAKHNLTLVGFYHVPIAALVMGFSMLVVARRRGVMILFCIGTILAFCNSFFNVSPIIWLTIPVLCCSIIAGAGMQALAWSGSADRKWILAAAVIMMALSIVTLLLATKYFQVFAGLGAGYAKIFLQAAKMYILGAIAAAIVFFMARAKLRIRWLRLAVLCSATAVDIFFGARFIVDKTF